MPTYNYKCAECDNEFEIFQSINDDNLTDCIKCKSKKSVNRLITGGTGMIFKGDGFYITDYKKNIKSEDNNKKEQKSKKNKKDNKKGKKNEQS